jgi:PAS domain S-box-containing protein
MNRPTVKVLLIEDDKDDYILVRSLLTEVQSTRYELQWIASFEEAKSALARCEHDAYLVDYRLGGRTGLELLTEAVARNCTAPIILLTGQGDYDVDMEAMKSGAADYLVKDSISAPLLERSIRYAIERKSNERELNRYRHHLEEMVAERARQFEEANSKLLRENAERKRAESALRESENKFREMADLLPLAIFELDRECGLTFINRAGLESFGYTQKDFQKGLNALDWVVPEERETVLANIRNRFLEKGTQGNEYTALRKDGSTFPVVVFSSPLIRDDQVLGLRGVVLDITERKRAEERMVQQNDFLKNVLESLTHPFYVLDAETYKILMANSAAAPGGLPQDVTCHVLTHRRKSPCNSTEHLCPLKTIKDTGRPLTVEHLHYDLDGNARNMEVHGYPIFDKDGKVIQIIEYSLDITERKKLEEELQQSSEKIKLFAYSISHDLKSPAVGIHGLTRLLHSHYRGSLDERGRQYCDQILKASEQVLSLIEDINIFIKTKETPLDFENLNPKDILRAVREEFAAPLKTREVNWVEPEDLPPVTADRKSLVRLFRNLVDNALKYGGTQLSEIRIGYGATTGFHVFSVSDNGIGMKKEGCEKVFGLFQRQETSKGTEGTGLGLAIVREIAKKHRGKAWVEPGEERGVTFYVSLSKSGA